MRGSFEESLAASLAWASVDSEGADLLRSLQWIWQVWSAGFEQIPPCLIHDLGLVLWRGPGVRFASARRPDEERTRRLRIEDRLLAPWLLDAGVRGAHVLLAGLPLDQVDRAVAHAVALALGRVATDLPSGDAGRMRGVIERWTGPLDREWLLQRAGPAFEAHGPAVDRLVDWFGGRAPFGQEDLWELSHLQEVPSEAARLSLRTMHQVAHWIGRPSPSTLLALRRRAKEIPLEDPSSDVYPTGGFDAMSTRGAIENLVRSEVSYVGEGVLDDSRIDMFDLRYLEGELLYYTRDESPLLEERRRLSVAVELPELRHKVRELSTQTGVLCLGCAIRLHADLLEGVGPLAVDTRLLLIDPDPAIREEEAALVRLSLAADIAHRRAEVLCGEDLEELPDPRRVVFSVRPRPSGIQARAWIRVGRRRFAVEQGAVGRKPAKTVTSEVDAADREALRGLLDRLLLTT